MCYGRSMGVRKSTYPEVEEYTIQLAPAGADTGCL